MPDNIANFPRRPIRRSVLLGMISRKAYESFSQHPSALRELTIALRSGVSSIADDQLRFGADL